jgi:hypothetical protein
MLSIVNIVSSVITTSPIRVFLAGVCVGIGISAFFAAELLRRLGRPVDTGVTSEYDITDGKLVHIDRVTLVPNRADVASRRSSRSENLPIV